jgi:diaminohydroxyphosphoribosylaminopyrimidine deaminase/5-amino-6-(5-phosphoribosylamino)uracil reductase
MEAALQAAYAHRGATAPNPPVGAAAWNREGQLLGVAAHARAGTAHAEARLLEELRAKGHFEQIHSVFVTLEPCNHFGRTGPCTQALLASPVREVLIGAIDPNPAVAGGGRAALSRAGVQVAQVSAPSLREHCEELIAPFRKRVTTGRPWVTVKTAHRFGMGLWEGMVPPRGQKTFTQPESLDWAHGLRKRADAVLTGAGTVLADAPLFTVRRVEDHPDRGPRPVAVLDRRGRVGAEWWEKARTRGLAPFRAAGLEEALDELGRLGCLEVLVEAGPTLSRAVIESGQWDEWFQIHAAGEGSETDRIERYRPEQKAW